MPDLEDALHTLTLFIGQFLSDPGEFGSQLRDEDEASLLLVGHLHGLQDLLLRRLLLELPVHDAQEGGEVQLSGPICKQGDDVQQLMFTH